MTLTEQWEKGELEWGKNYYCRNVKTNETNICFLYGNTWYSADSDGEGDIDWQGYLEILAPVPSYEEWKNVTNCFDYEHKAYVKMSEENQQLRKWCEEFNTLEVAKENQQLKELLYNSMVYLNCHINDDGDVFVNGVSTSSFIEEIDNAIGGKK